MKTMTTDLLTFFQPGDDAGTAWTFSYGSNSSQRTAWAYAPGEVDLLPFANWDISSEEQFKKLLGEARDVVQKQGGILVEAKVHNDVIRLTLFSGHEAPRKMLRLRPFGDPRVEAFPESTDLEAGDHLILPVSAAAEQRLDIFNEVCDGFPADLRSTLWNVIRRPSLEWRIQRIEEILSLPPATQAERQKSRQRQATFLEKLSRWFLWPIPAGPVAAALLLVVGACASYSLWLGDTQATEQTETATAGTEGRTTAPATDSKPESSGPDPGSFAKAGTSQIPPEDAEAKAEMKKSLEGLFRALAGQPEGSATRKLSKDYFEGRAGKEFENGSVVWGIAKLEALRLGLIEETDSSLLEKTTLTSFKKELENSQKSDKLKSDEDALELLAWSACQYYKKPVLMVKADDLFPYPFVTDRTCDEIKLEEAIAGVEDLTEWVEKQNS